jgi:single-stranded DNA-binding protein
MWVTVTAWETLAERLAEHLHRGDTVIVEARDDLSVWAYLNQSNDKPAGHLQVTAANVELPPVSGHPRFGVNGCDLTGCGVVRSRPD